MKIKAAVISEIGRKRPYSETKPLAIEELELDPPGPGEVLVRVAAAGVRIVGRTCDGFRQADITSARTLGHPLTACPGDIRVTAEQSRQCTFDEGAVFSGEERAGSSVRHREWTGVHVPRGIEHVRECELMNTRQRAALALVRSCDNAFFRCDALCLFPKRCELDPIDALSPCIPLLKHGLVVDACERIAIKRSAGELADFDQGGLDGHKQVLRHRVPQIPAEHCVGQIRIPKFGR